MSPESDLLILRDFPFHIELYGRSEGLGLLGVLSMVNVLLPDCVSVFCPINDVDNEPADDANLLAAA